MAITVATERSVTEETRREDAGRPLPEPRRRSLLTTLFVVNAAVLVLIVVLLSVTPITISGPVIRPSELVVVLAAFLVLMALHLVLLRRVLSPLQKLSDLMRTIDPARPGRRLEGVPLREAEVATLARRVQRHARSPRSSSDARARAWPWPRRNASVCASRGSCTTRSARA